MKVIFDKIILAHWIQIYFYVFKINAIIDSYFDKLVNPTSVLKYTCQSTYENREHILIIVQEYGPRNVISVEQFYFINTGISQCILHMYFA
jgi:hypothetical protein